MAFPDSILNALRSLGVMFSNPTANVPPGQVPSAGIMFDGGGVPTGIRNQLGAVVAFPSTGGVTTYAALTDAATVALPTVNAPLAAALAQEGTPAAFATRALVAADDGHNLICAAAAVATVNAGLGLSFGCAFKGDVTFAGTATVTDVRTTGATNPWCTLMATALDTYDVVGSKI